MKGFVTWFCVGCQDSDSHRMKVKIVAHEPGSWLICVWSHLLPAKRRVTINTLCAECLNEAEMPSSKEQRSFIEKKKAQLLFQRDVSWMKQEWEVWVTSRECELINTSLRENEGLHIHLVGGVSIA
ncbi:unnamed protein product [Penicillium salamii]|uniref:Uncharacterized protein n=1 Tax=Penicillium salamii TaxID=1612424 RepID=A0A9W4JW83_9EURO|nr:unnamed protein product [Penicillium salamii]